MYDRKTGIFLKNDLKLHRNNLNVLENLKYFMLKYEIKNFLDLGCGTAFYARELVKIGLIGDAYDGNPFTKELSDNFAGIIDLSKSFNLDRQYDCVISLEVGEHIPVEYEQVFIENIIKHSKKFIILSWAIPGQPGTGHVNCRDNDYIIRILNKNNYKYMFDETQIFRKNISKYNFFKNTIMIFELIF